MTLDLACGRVGVGLTSFLVGPLATAVPKLNKLGNCKTKDGT